MPTGRVTRCADWLTVEDLEGFDGYPWDLDAGQIDEVIDAASDWLYEHTSGQFTGPCELIWRPVDPHCSSWAGTGMWCGCARPSTVFLPFGPVQSIEAVVEGTTTLVRDVDYRLIAPNRLVRVGRAWPACNDPRVLPNVDARGSWYVRYTYGNPIPPLGKFAAIALAADFAKATGGTGKCALPAGTVSVSGMGITVNLDAEQAGKSLPAVAAFLAAYPGRTVIGMRTGRRRGFVDVLGS